MNLFNSTVYQSCYVMILCEGKIVVEKFVSNLHLKFERIY
jgi:hypothetical protein